MTDWADDIAARVVGSPTDIAMTLRTERALAKAVERELQDQIDRLKAALAASEHRSLDRLRTLRGMQAKAERV